MNPYYKGKDLIVDTQKIKTSLESLTIIFDKIDAPEVRTAIGILLNLVESLAKEKEADRKTIQELTNEINRLKGEKGKPKIRPQKNNGKDDHSSEEERKKRKKKNKKDTKAKKKGVVKSDRTVICKIDNLGINFLLGRTWGYLFYLYNESSQYKNIKNNN